MVSLPRLLMAGTRLVAGAGLASAVRPGAGALGTGVARHNFQPLEHRAVPSRWGQGALQTCCQTQGAPGRRAHI